MGKPVAHMQKMQGEADNSNKERLAMLEKVITEHILIPPKFARYPEVEEILWRTVQRAITGEMTINDALRYMRKQVEQIVHADTQMMSNGRRKTVLSRHTR